jgi:hypothetical protein
MLTGKFTAQSSIEADNHRAFNRRGESFDRGKTFSGVDYETGLKAVDELRARPCGSDDAAVCLTLEFDS